MKNLFLILISSIAWGCSQYASTEKLREVKTFSVQIVFSDFSQESGRYTLITSQEIKRWQVGPNVKKDTISVKLSPEQLTEIKNSLERIPLTEIKKEYKNEKVKDGGAISFDFDLDGEHYKIFYINHPLHPNLKEFNDLIENIMTDK